MRRLALAFVAVLWACGDGGGSTPVDATEGTGDLALDGTVDGAEDPAGEAPDAPAEAEAAGPAPLTVGFAGYAGAYPLINNAEVRLFKQTPDGKPKCAGLTVGDVGKMAATIASPTIPIDGAYGFLVLPNLEADKTQAYTIVGLARHGQGPTQAWACDDVKGQVEWAKSLNVDLVLQDLPPTAAGAYDATTTIDLATGLPTEAAARVAGMAAFVEDPAGETLRVSCLAAGTTGELADFCAVLFASKEDPDLAAMTGVGLAVLTMVRKNVAAGLTAKDAMTAMKVWLTSALTVGAAFDVEGKCAGPACGESWTTFHGQAPGAQVVDVPFGPVDAAVELERKGLAGLMVKSHAVGLGYGQLADLAVEKVLLPARFGGGTPEVSTFEAAMGAALGKKACLSDGSCCSAFAAAANKAQPGYPESFFKDGCMALTSEGAAWLRARLVGLDPVGGSLKLGTIDPCHMTDANEDMEVDGIASSAAPCAMDAVFDVGTESFVPQVSFHGTRK